MEFEYTITNILFVEEYEFNEMLELVNEKGLTYEAAFREVTAGWDDYEYYHADYIEDDTIKELKKRNKK